MDDSSAAADMPLATPNQRVEAVEEDEVELPKQSSTTPIDVTPPSAQPMSPTISALQSLTDRALQFLGDASNETLGVCFAGLGLSTYLVLGRVGLLIIGIVGGVVLHATWEGVRLDDRDDATKEAEQERRREAGIEVVRRVLEWRSTSRMAGEKARDSKMFVSQEMDYSAFGPETSSALNFFTDAVIQNYVHWWYDPVIPEELNFPTSCRRTFVAFVLSLSGHLQRKRSADVFLDFVANASSIIIVFLTELSSALNASPNVPVDQAISTYLKLKPESSLSYMLDHDSQKSKLAEAAEDILQSYLDPKSYNCQPVHAFLKAVLAQIVLGYTVDSCSRPEWINDWIVYGLEESETTKEVMDIVDASVQKGAKNGSNGALAKAEVIDQANAKKSVDSGRPHTEHRRQMSRAEEAMDEAMQEARRLTELMIAEDERLAKDSKEKDDVEVHESSVEENSERTSPGTPTPTSSQGDLDKTVDDSRFSQERGPDNTLGSPFANKERDSPSVGQFTSFDQIVPRAQLTALSTEDSDKPRQTLTLHNAIVSIFDDSNPGERTSIKAKPSIDYLIQIEPASSAFPGWMISRKYADFETLHEVLRRISVITGAGFTGVHAELPRWKVHTKATLRAELERYLCDAVRYQPLAESEGMKRFLERDRGLDKSPSSSTKGFGWPTPEAFGKLGGDMMGALTKAPKQVAGGGKAVIGGVAGLVGASKRQSQSQVSLNGPASNVASEEASTSANRSQSSLNLSSPGENVTGSLPMGRPSHDTSRDRQPTLERRGSNATMTSVDSGQKPGASPLRPRSIIDPGDNPESGASQPATKLRSPVAISDLEDDIVLPPPPSEMPADYIAPASPSRKSTDISHLSPTPLDQRIKAMTESDALPPPTPPRPKPASNNPAPKPKEALTERETSIAIELVFAIISQLYTLSSAWQFRRTLLAAAKTFLLRPGNVQLVSIKDLLQTSLLDSNLSDEGLAHHVLKLRANTLPTDEEMEIWRRDYPEKSAEQKEELRIKARKLLVSKGMPQALTSVMGAAASGEALGKVFDCLQIPAVSRGLIHGLLLQALRIVTN